MSTLLQDLRYGMRGLLRSPVFTCVSVLSLALGIGANTAIFSLTDQILLRTLPVPDPQQLVVLRSPGPQNGHCWSDIDNCAQSFSYPMYKALREQAPFFLVCWHTAASRSMFPGTARPRARMVY